MKIDGLSDDELVAAVKRYARRERAVTAALDRVLDEMDARFPGMRQDWPRRVIGDESRLRLATKRPSRKR